MKLNNQGFTLIELLGVIVLLAVITTIAVPSVMGISRKLKQNMLETKIDLILEDAKLYGQDYLSTISGSSKNITLDSKSYPCISVSIGELVEAGYLTEDEEVDPTQDKKILNPVDNTYLDDYNIILYYKNKRVVSTMADEDLDGTPEKTCG